MRPHRSRRQPGIDVRQTVQFPSVGTDGDRVAEQTYARLGPNRIVIDHTAVGPKLQGKGLARRLLDALVAWARETGTRVSATCSYAKAQFQKDASLRDVYDP